MRNLSQYLKDLQHKEVKDHQMLVKKLIQMEILVNSAKHQDKVHLRY